MKNKKPYLVASICLLALVGCGKIESNYYTDTNTTGTAIFSNTANNVTTCLFNGHPWRTVERSIGGLFGRSSTELQIRRIQTVSALDTLFISWKSGQYNVDNYDISLVLPVAKNFTWKDISNFQGKRIAIDSTNGFFVLSQDSYYLYNRQNLTAGKGSIYFNTAYLDSSSATYDNFRGRISGLFEARINTNTINAVISSGRFDDAITGGEIRPY